MVQFTSSGNHQYPLLIGCHSFSPTNHLVVENHRSLIQICITPSVESTPGFFPSASPVMSRLASSVLIHLSAHLCYHHHSRHPTLLHSFTPGSKPIPFQQILPILDFFYLPDCLHDTGLDRTYHAHRFIFSFTFNFLFIPCGRLSWLPDSFLLHVKYTLSYRIIFSLNSYGKVHI